MMLGLDGRVARWTWTVVAVLVLLHALYDIRETIFILVISILFAYLLTPMVNVINRMLPGKSRTPGLALTYLVLIAVLVVAGIEIGSQVADQLTALVADAPQLVKKLQYTTPNTPNLPYLQLLKGDLLGRARGYLMSHSADIVNYLPSAGLKVLSLSSYLIYVVLVPIISFFLLKDGAGISREVHSLIPDGPHKSMWLHVLSDTNVLLGRYVRAVGILCLNTFVVFLIFFQILGVPYAILLAAIAFPLEFVPLVGPLAAGFIIVVVMLATGYAKWLTVLIFLGVYRMIQDYVISPRLMSAGVEVHPLLVIVGVLAGEKLAGIPGMFLSVPIIAMLRVVLRRVGEERRTREHVELVT